MRSPNIVRAAAAAELLKNGSYDLGIRGGAKAAAADLKPFPRSDRMKYSAAVGENFDPNPGDGNRVDLWCGSSILSLQDNKNIC